MQCCLSVRFLDDYLILTVLMYSSCKRCPVDDASACILPYILVSLIYSPILPAVDARGVGCAALQGTPFSSTHSSSTADLKRLQSLGEAAFSQTLSLLSDKQFTKYCKMCSLKFIGNTALSLSQTPT